MAFYKKFFLILFSLVILTVLSTPQRAWARKWAFGDDRLWNVFRVCQDGAEVVVLFAPSHDPDYLTDFTQSFNLIAEKVETNFPLPNPDTAALPVNYVRGAYGADLGTFTTVLFRQALPFSTNRDDHLANSGMENYYNYAHDTFLFSINPLPVGSQVVVIQEEKNLGILLEVQDCSFQGSSPPPGSRVIQASDLIGDGSIFDPAYIYYRIDKVPALGELRLFGQLANAHRTVIKFDVDGGNVTFTPHSPGPGETLGYTALYTKVVSYSQIPSRNLLNEQGSLGLNSRPNSSNGDSRNPDISADGRFIAFESDADDLAFNDTNFTTDVFVYDQLNASLERASLDSSGNQGGYLAATHPSISANGRFVAFMSESDGFVSNDTNTAEDIFVRDLQNDLTERVSVNSQNEQADAYSVRPSISGDGQLVAFHSFAVTLVPDDNNYTCDLDGDGNYFENCPDIFLRDRLNSITALVSISTSGEQGNRASVEAAISADGRFVAFTSDATNLVSGDQNQKSDIFVHDLQSGRTLRVSISSAGAEGNNHSFNPFISANGRFVVFASYASNLTSGDSDNQSDIFVYDRDTDGDGVFDEAEQVRTELVSIPPEDSNPLTHISARQPSISADGRFVAYVSWTEKRMESPGGVVNSIFLDEALVYDRLTGITQRIGQYDRYLFNSSSNPKVSSDGRYAAATTNTFNSSSYNDVYAISLAGKHTLRLFPSVFLPAIRR